MKKMVGDVEIDQEVYDDDGICAGCARVAGEVALTGSAKVQVGPDRVERRGAERLVFCVPCARAIGAALVAVSLAPPQKRGGPQDW